MDYDKLLEKAYSEVKEVKGSSERFEIPKAEGRVEGTKTIITNFAKICSILRREQKHLGKFLEKELATPGKMEGDKLVLNRKLNSALINAKLADYTNEFVICPECKKPDTELVKENRFTFLKCLACGAKKSVRGKFI